MRNKLFLKLSILFTLIFSIASVINAAGVLDTAFGTQGKVTTQIELFEFEDLSDVITQPDGKFIVVGKRFDASSFSFFKFIARFNTNGSPDTSFGINGKTDISISPLAILDAKIQSDGKIVIVGSSAGDFFVARFTSQGLFDESFGSGGVVTFNQGSFDIFRSVAIQSDGKIVAAGNTSDGGNRGAVIRFNPNGSIDTTFAQQGSFYFTFTTTSTVTSAGYFDVKVLPNGKILTAATYYRTSDRFRGYFLTMLNSAGEIDLSFGSQGFAGNGRNQFCSSCSQEQAASFEVLPDGKIFVASFGGITVYDYNGNIYRQLPFEGSKTTLLPDGKVLVLGGSPFIGFVKLYSSESFIGQAQFPFRQVLTVSQPNGKILLAGFESGFLTFWKFNLITSQGTRITDYNGDGKTDLGVYRTSSSVVYFLNGNGPSFNLPLQTTKIIPEFSGYRLPNEFLSGRLIIHWTRAANGLPSQYNEVDGDDRQIFFSQPWGLPEDIPTGGDFNGDAITDLTVFRPSTGVWYSIRGNNGANQALQWGTNGDKPVPADYDYDGITDYAVYRPSTGTWWIRRSSDGTSFAVQFGEASDIPLTGDFDGDGHADFVVFRPSNGVWYQFLTTAGFRAIQFGFGTDVPVPGDYDGDGRHDIAVFRQGVWYLQQSTEGFKGIQWGTNGDVPVSVRYDQ